MPSTTTTTTTTTTADGVTTTTTTTTTTTAPSAEEGVPVLASATFEDPKSLPFALPKGIDEVDAAWMSALLQHRGVLPAGVSVASIEKKDVGMTAGYFSSIAKIECTFSAPVPVGTPTKFVAKAWPPFELLPKEAIGNMFVNDIKGYSEYPADEFYPRPRAFLASYDVDENLYALVMEDATEIAEQKVHENELTLEETKRMLPKMAKLAAMYEDCHTEASPMHERCAYLPLWAQAENLGIYFGEEGKPFSDGMGLHDELMAKHAIGGEWSKLEPSMEGYATLLGSKWEQFWARSHPENGASVTISHGDLRGDNLFLTDSNDDGWLLIDFQLMFKGPIPSDLAYLMSSGSVLPSVYNDGEEEVLQLFYDEFQKHTKAYTPDK